MIYLILGLIALAGAANAVMDRSEEGRFKRMYWRKEYSWVLKWERLYSTDYLYLSGMKENSTALWYYIWLYNPPYKERFPYSSTLLVALTDGWHLAKLVCFASIFAAMGLCAVYLNLHKAGFWEFVKYGILFRGTFGISFTLFYNKILVK